MDDLVSIGRIHRVVGLDGRLEVELYSGDASRLSPGTSIRIGEESLKVVRASPGRSLKGGERRFRLTLEGIASRESAIRLRGLEMEIPRGSIPDPPEGSYYHFRLMGADVVDSTGRCIGRISGIMETGANDVFVVDSGDGKEILIPVIRGTVSRIDAENGTVYVDLPGDSEGAHAEEPGPPESS